jgi:hypothetical protein
MFDKPFKWLRKYWWGLVIAYLLLLIGAYLTIWQFIEPLGIPDNLGEVSAFIKTRVFYHLNLTLLFAAHVTLILDLILRYKERAGKDKQDEKMLLEKIGFGDSDTPIESCWKFSERSNSPQPNLTSFNDGFFGKALEVKSTVRYAADYDVQPHASLGSSVEFVIKQNDSSARIYAHLIVLSRDGSQSKTVWLDFPIGVGNPSPASERDVEWKYPVKPQYLEGNWLQFHVDLNEAVDRTFGNKGWRYGQLKGFRLRGNLSLAYIGVFAQK